MRVSIAGNQPKVRQPQQKWYVPFFVAVMNALGNGSANKTSPRSSKRALPGPAAAPPAVRRSQKAKDPDSCGMVI
jgi:hypothetical protein